MAKKDMFSDADFSDIEKQLSELHFTEQDEQQFEQMRKELAEFTFPEQDFQLLEQELSELKDFDFELFDDFELFLFDSDLDFLLF